MPSGFYLRTIEAPNKKRATSTHLPWVKVTLSSALLVTTSILSLVNSFVNIVIVVKSEGWLLCILHNSCFITKYRGEALNLELLHEKLALAQEQIIYVPAASPQSFKIPLSFGNAKICLIDCF